MALDIEPTSIWEYRVVKKALEARESITFITLIIILGSISIIVLQRWRNKNKLLKAKLILNQINPHFISNALNAIINLVDKMNHNSPISGYIRNFSQLIRFVLQDEEVIMRTLNEELEFTSNYLQLEKLRYGSKFQYNIELLEDLGLNGYVPKMILQTFVSNAIQHGFKPLKAGEGN